MKKQVAITKEYRRSLKRRLIEALAMLMAALILAVGVTYAWLTLSVAPEVFGIVTHVGANGSLEVALLNADTYADPNTVKTPGLGESLAASSPEANERWGNLINLDSAQYGLQEIVLYPARLNAVPTADGKGYQVGDKMLSVPTYGYDGRIVDLTDNTVPGVFNQSEFVYDLNNIGYGVRAIGATNSLSVQASYLSTAKANITGYTKSAQNAAIASINGMKDLILKIAAGKDATFTNEDVAILTKMIIGLQSSENYIENSLRQGLVVIAASVEADEDKFSLLREQITNEKKTITQVLTDLDMSGVPGEFATWVAAQEQMQSNLLNAKAVCDELTDNKHTFDEIREALDYLMDLNKVYVGEMTNGKLILNATEDDLKQLPLTVTLAPDSGIYATVADFTGNYSADVGNVAKVKTVSGLSTAHLPTLSDTIANLTPADGGEVNKPVTLTETYGYALDLAFRCNAYSSDLLLQTEGAQRVYSDSSSAATMGSGSFMEFATMGTGMGANDITKLIDAVRVAFIDNQGNILGIAKMNTSNREIAIDGSVRVPLYLYRFEIGTEGEDEGKLLMGERQKDSNTIVALDQNIAKSVTTLVWLDGDVVDNTMFSSESSLTGTLNLQFASSVDLTPLDNHKLMNYMVDKSALSDALESARSIYLAGQSHYTTDSWNAFTAAYEYADKINSELSATPMLVDRAGKNLQQAQEALAGITVQALQDKVTEVRAVTGKTDVIGAYVSKEGKTEILPDGEATAPGDAKGTIYRVDYNKNLHDEGNGYLTRIYDDESWKALAQALYKAEAVLFDENPTTELIDKTISDLSAAYIGLERSVYYVPYDYEGKLYYMAISDEEDTYGKWYTADFKRIVADLAVLNLDAYAEPVSIVSVGSQGRFDYIESNTTGTALPLALMTEVYGSLKDQTIIANNWILPDGFTFSSGYAGSMIENTDPIVLNVKADTFDVNELYAMPAELLNLILTDVEVGDHVINGYLLTDAGVLFHCEKVLNVYSKSDSVTITGDSALSVSVDDSGALEAQLVGGSESIATYKWYLSSGNTTTLSINEFNGGWKAVQPGTVTVVVQVETAQGNTYTSQPITIIVTK